MNIGQWKPSLLKRGLTSLAFIMIMTIAVISTNLSFSSAPALADDQSTVRSLHDVQGHWAGNQINQGIAAGWLSGYPDGSFKPDQAINRAEFVTVLNRAAGYRETKEIAFTDVSSTDWFAADLAKAIAVGYISGYSDRSFKPGKAVTRQEAATILARAAKLNSSVLTANYKDKGEIASWSASSVAAVSSQGFLTGYPDGCFKPERAMTRAEALVCLSKVFGNRATTFGTAGVYGPTSGIKDLKGNVTIACTGVVLQNTKIDGDLLLSEGIGDGEVSLKNITVTGNTTIRGGGTHSVLIDNSTLPTLTVEKDAVRVVASGNTSVNAVQVNSGATLVESGLSGQGFETVTLSQSIPASASVTLTGNFGQVNVQAPNAQVNLSGGTVAALQVADTAQKSAILIAADAGVKTLTLNAPINITGQGKISTANINVTGSTIAQTPGSVQLGNGVSSTIGGTLSSTSTTGSGSGSGTGTGNGDAPLSLLSSDPANGATGVSANPNIKLTFDRGVVRDYWTNNQSCITMATSSGTPVSITVSRIADNEDEKRNIYIAPNSALSAGQTYKVTISSGLMANNGNTMGITREVTFTVAGASGGGPAPVTAGKLTISDGDGRSSLGAKAPNGPNDGTQSNQNVMSFKLAADTTENIKIATGNNITLNVSNITGLVKNDLTNWEIYTDPNGNGQTDDGSRIATGSLGDITANAAVVSFNVEAEQTVNTSVYMNYIVQLDIANWDDNDTFTLASNSIGITATGCNTGAAATVDGGIQERAFTNLAVSLAITKQDYSALALNEGSLNGAKIRVKATGTAFISTTVSKTDFELVNAPGNLTIASLAKVSGTQNMVVDLTLSYSGDFDADITNFAVKAKSSATSLGSALTSNFTTLTAVVEP